MKPSSRRFASVLLLPVLAAVLGGCGNSWSFNSNLDPDNFHSYFAPGSVDVIAADAVGQRPLIGPVSGESCQTAADEPPASDADARTQLRGNAAALKADAVVVNSCERLAADATPPDCLSMVICTGHAYGAQPDS